MITADLKTGSSWRGWFRWGGAAAIVLVTHVAAGAWIIAQQDPTKASTGEGAEAIMVELAPLHVPAAIEEATEAQPEATPPEDIAMPPLPETAEPVLDMTEVQPPPAPVPEPEVVLPATMPPVKEPEKKPEVKKPDERKPKPQVVKEKKERKPETKEAASPASHTASLPSPMASATGRVATTSSATANWNGTLYARISKAARQRRQSQAGTVEIRFVLDRSGRVLSSLVVVSSGSPELDREALALIKRVSPLPAPPPEKVGDTIPVTVPIRFKGS